MAKELGLHTAFVQESALNRHCGGRGEPLVLLHGIGGSWRDWAPVLPELERDFAVIAFDLPGFGDSPVQPPRPATIDGQADAIERELDAMGHPTVHVAGNSSGGWLALELARRGRARRVVAFAPAGMWTRREDLYRYILLRNAYYSARVLRRFPGLTRTAVRRWLLGFSIFMAHPGRLSGAEAHASMQALGGAPGYMDFLDWTRGRQVEGLAEVACRVLIAWGSRDRLLPRRQGGRFVRALPRGQFRLLRGVGHVPIADNPELVASTVREFLPTPADRSGV